MASTERTVRLSAAEARLLEDTAKAHDMTVSEVVRSAVVLWREYVGHRQAALEQWAARLVAEYGPDARLAACVNDELSLELDIDGRPVDELVAEAVRDGRAADDLVAEAVLDGEGHVQLWVCEPDSDARVCLGRVRALPGAAIVVPIAALAALGGSDGATF